MVVLNDKDIRLTDKRAIKLAKKRALRENRSAANAAAQTIIEALDSKGSATVHGDNFKHSIVEKNT